MGWLLACLCSVLLWRTRRQLKALLRATPSAIEAASAQPAPASYQNVPLAYQHLHNLVVLCLELGTLISQRRSIRCRQTSSATSGRPRKARRGTRLGPRHGSCSSTSTCYESPRPGPRRQPRSRRSRRPRPISILHQRTSRQNCSTVSKYPHCLPPRRHLLLRLRRQRAALRPFLRLLL